MDKDKKIQELSMLQQNIANISAQKQQFVSQLTEFESASKALDKTNNAYKIIGNIMIASEKEDIKKELKEKQEMFTIRIKTLEKQENNLKEKAEVMQKEIMSKIDKE